MSPAPPPLYVFGYPGPHGGARTELWHTLRLWRRYGLAVTCIPLWKADPAWKARLDEIGVGTLILSPRAVRLPEGSTCISFCEHPFLRICPQLRGCRRLWAPCMNFHCDAETALLREHGPLEGYVFQSRYQQAQLGPLLESHGARIDTFHRVPGAFAWWDWPFCPGVHRPGQPLVIGRISRADPAKYSPRLWKIYGNIPNVRARVMAWSPAVQTRCGPPPPWAEVLPKGAEPAEGFVRSLHVLVHPGGRAVENWPRFVLEAMASGVPVVTDASGGLPEMIDDGRSGFLCHPPDRMAETALLLAEREDLRQEIAARARTALENDLADPRTIWACWHRLFDGLG